MQRILLGLDEFQKNEQLHKLAEGNIGYLCHQASINSQFEFGASIMQNIFKERLTVLFGPQHGLMTDLQENMIETEHNIHPHFKIPVYSLYSETRKPTPEMLKNIDTLIIDLQDIGTRIYTYIYTLYYCMEAAVENQKKIIVLDRPNPLGGNKVEGPMLEKEYASFVGLFPLPLVHGLTMGEMALYIKAHFFPRINLEIVKATNWKRHMLWEETLLPWTPPSPNIPTPMGCLTFPLTVLYEGTNLSEARGTTRPLEMVGAPQIEPFSFAQHLNTKYAQEFKGITFRPTYFRPTHHKFKDETCGGVHIHITDWNKCHSWLAGVLLLKEFHDVLGKAFSWREPPYEYEYSKLPIDIINGSDAIRKAIENNDSLENIKAMDYSDFNEKRKEFLIYE